jgi:RND family efflux transporter MFP subunit
MGRVDRVLVEEGDVVTRGQALAAIESRDVAARIAQARAAVAAARAMEQNALRMRERMERLHARDAASEKDLEDATAGHEAALAELAAAEEGVKAAEVQLDYARIVAPFDGVVVEKRIQPGDLATPGVPLFVIDDVHRVKIEAQVPETDASRVRLGDPVRVRFRDETLEARVTELVPAADPRSRTFTVRATVDNPDLELRPGMFARLTLAGGERAALTIPSRAVVRRGPLTGVFVVETGPQGDAHARLRWITLGEDRDDRVEVLTGLDAGESIVVEPVTQLSDGQPVGVAG